MFEERIAAMNQRTEEAMAANAVQFDKRTYTVDEIQDILGIRFVRWCCRWHCALAWLLLLLPMAVSLWRKWNSPS